MLYQWSEGRRICNAGASCGSRERAGLSLRFTLGLLRNKNRAGIQIGSDTLNTQHQGH